VGPGSEGEGGRRCSHFLINPFAFLSRGVYRLLAEVYKITLFLDFLLQAESRCAALTP
jgi:hypothetical protein